MTRHLFFWGAFIGLISDAREKNGILTAPTILMLNFNKEFLSSAISIIGLNYFNEQLVILH